LAPSRPCRRCSSGCGGRGASLAALGQAPGIAPPDYAYLDDARVALYLGQLEGGLATSEQLTQQLTKSGTAGVSAGGFSLGGSTGSSATAERVVTPTATARFYQLLDLLGRDGYLHPIDMAQSPKRVVRDFAAVPQGSFVQLRNCTVKLPGYVQFLQAVQSPGFDWTDPLGIGGSVTNPATAPIWASQEAEALAGRIHAMTGAAAGSYPVGMVKRIDSAVHALVGTVGRNPRVPMATCDGNADVTKPRGIDLLFPIQLANFTPEPGLVSGPLTVVGKLVLAVRNKGVDYVDDESLTTFSKALIRLDSADGANQGDSGGTYLDELYADAVVLPPGAVIIPIAIYR
jgi:hypothetical protein